MILSGCSTVTDMVDVELTGISFRPAVDRRELAGTGSLSLPRRT